MRFDGVSTGARRAAAETRAAVKGVGDQADRETKRLNLLGPALQRTMQLAAAGLVALGVGAAVGMKKAVDAASNLNEAVNATKVTFKESADDILTWSKTTATSMGISQRAALEAANGFGNMLRTSGLATDEAARMSKEMVQLAADMASLHNQDPTEMLERIRSGLAGEAEPLRRFGVLLSEAAVQQEAVNLGLVKHGEKLTEAEKVQARYRLILQQTTTAHGDAKNTIDQEAGSRRVFNALLEETAARLGKVLLPAVTSVRRAMNDWLSDPANQRMLEELTESIVDGLGAALRAVADFIGDHRDDFAEFFRETAEAIGDIAAAADTLAEKIGGWEEAFKFTAIIASLAKLRGVAAAAGAGSGLLGAASAAGLLRTRLLALTRMGPIAIGIALSYLQGALPNDAAARKAGRIRINDEISYDPATGKFYGGSGPDQIPVPESLAAKRAGLSLAELRARVRSSSTSSSVGDTAADKASLSSKGANLSAKYGGLQPGTTALAGFVESSGGVISAGREAGHSPTGGHGVGQSLDISWSNNGPRIWAALFPHRAKFRLLLGPPGLYMWGRQYENERDKKNHQNHIHVQYQGSPAELRKMLGDKAPEITGGGPIPGARELDPDPRTGDSPTKKATIDSRDLSSARGTARFINTHLESIASPTVRARIRQRAALIVDALGEVTDPKEFARIRRNLNALERDFENGVKLTAATRQAQQTARNISTALSRMPDALQAELRPKLEKLRPSWGT